MLTSLSNPKIKFVRSLSRRRARTEAQQFVIEGVRLIEEAVGAGLVPALVLYAARVLENVRGRALIERLQSSAGETIEVSDAIMRALTSTETPQGILAVVPFVQLPAPAHADLLLILDAVRDPGNLGAILRSARAAGVDWVLLAPGTVDAYNDKAVRAAMGAHFVVPIHAKSWAEIETLTQNFPRRYVADPAGELEYTRADWRQPVALIIGGEAEGAHDPAKKIATARVRIPMRGNAESLNAAMAATVLLFEAARGKATNTPDE
ncbi:MAG: RNA methyltransferase [Chloroflexi bacterium]|nr:RNA methyltransferase [Chloroflexota bacterium]